MGGSVPSTSCSGNQVTGAKSKFSYLLYLTHLSSPGEPITRLADADVEAELPDPQVPHGVLGLILSSLNHLDLSEIRSEVRRLLESSAQVSADNHQEATETLEQCFLSSCGFPGSWGCHHHDLER